MSIKTNVEEILEDIKKYSPYPEKVKLVAVTKYSSVEDIEQYRYLVGFRLLNKIIVPSEKYLERCVSLCKEGYLIKKENGYILNHKGLMLFNDFISNFIGD